MRTSLALVLSVAFSAGATGCQSSGGCVKGTVTAEPGRFVQLVGARVLELRARFEAKGQPVVGAEIAFDFTFKDPAKGKSGMTLKQVNTDASGVAVARMTIDELAIDARLNGTFDAMYTAEWTHTDKVGGAGPTYCATTGKASLPVAQFPPPKA